MILRKALLSAFIILIISMASSAFGWLDSSIPSFRRFVRGAGKIASRGGITIIVIPLLISGSPKEVKDICPVDITDIALVMAGAL
jgi:hypothetical protein